MTEQRIMNWPARWAVQQTRMNAASQCPYCLGCATERIDSDSGGGFCCWECGTKWGFDGRILWCPAEREANGNE